MHGASQVEASLQRQRANHEAELRSAQDRHESHVKHLGEMWRHQQEEAAARAAEQLSALHQRVASERQSALTEHTTLQQRWQAELDAQRRRTEQEVTAVRAELAHAQQLLDQERRDAARRLADNASASSERLAEALREHERQVRRILEAQQAQLQSERLAERERGRQHEAERLAESAVRHERALHEVRQEHAQHLLRVQQEHAAQLGDLQQQHEAATLTALKSLKTALTKDLQAGFDQASREQEARAREQMRRLRMNVEIAEKVCLNSFQSFFFSQNSINILLSTFHLFSESATSGG